MTPTSINPLLYLANANIMNRFLFGFCLFLAASTSFVAQAADGKCNAVEFQCSNTKDCPDSGFSLVTDCLDCEGDLNTDEGTFQCFTRKLLSAKGNPSPQYLWRDIVGMLVWFCAAGVATACGVGGGGIYVPLGIILIGFAPKPASGLSQCSIFGASLGGLLLNLKNMHPFTATIEKSGEVADGDGSPQGEIVSADVPTNDKGEPDTATTKYFTRPLIDYDMALFLAPMEMAGAVLGVVIQSLLPNWLYLFTAAVILGFTAKKTFAKWSTTRAKEIKRESVIRESMLASRALENATAAAATTPAATTDGENPKQSSITTTAKDSSSKSDGGEEIEVNADIPGVVANEDDESASDPNEGEEEIVMDAEKMARRLHFLERDSRQYPKEKLIVFAILWLGLTLLTFLKGGKGVKSLVGIDCKSPVYGVLIGVQFLWTFGFAMFYAVKLMRETEEKKSVGYPYHEQDVLWDFEKARFYAFVTFIAGIVAGLIGIGGGMVLGPLMLVMGIYPRVSTATTATMIVLTSSSVAILYITSGLVPWQYAITFFFTCFIGALVGKTKIDAYVKKTGRQSVLIFLLATIIALATCGAFGIALFRLSKNDWCFPGFKQFCVIDDGTADVVCAPGADERLLGSAFYSDVVRGGL